MSEQQRHEGGHPHVHGNGCGHQGVRHKGHVDYLHDGHLHHTQGGETFDHAIDVGGTNPSRCTNGHACQGHHGSHRHGPGCGHDAIPHGDHHDYVVAGHLHHPHDGHC